MSFGFIFVNSSPHPASSTIRGVVQSLGGVGEQGIALVLQVDEVTIRRGVSAAWREAASGIRRDKKTTGSGGKDLAAHEKQVTECAVRSVCAAGNPGTATVAGALYRVVAWVDAEKFSLGEETTARFDDLWHSMMRFRVFWFIYCAFSLTARLRRSRHGHDRKE